MGDRVARFEIGLGGDDTDITSLLAGLKTKFRSAIADLEATTGKVKLFEGLQDRTKAAADALADATKKASGLADELDKIQKSGGKGTDELTKSLKAANAEVATATREFNKTVDAVSKLQTQLSRAGVDTKNLAAEQTRLTAATRAATDAAANQAAQQLLGLKTLKDVSPEIQRINAAYNTLKSSGTLSVKELAIAQQQLKDKTAELRASVTSVSEAAASGGPDVLGFFTKTLLPAAGLTLSLGAVVQAFLSIVSAGREVKQATSEIGAVSNLTREQLATLEQGAKDLSDRIGTDVVGSLKTLKEIIRSTGASPEDALVILSASADTAKGSISDLNVVAKVAADLISAYGLQANETKGVLDGLFAGMKAGGPTFADLNGQVGGLAVAAKGVGVDVTTLTAFLNVMTSASGDASGSVNALQRILLSFNTAATRQKLKDLGIEATTFKDVMLELAEKGIPITKLIDLGIAGTKAAVGVTALTRSADDLTAALERQKTAAEQGAEALKKYLDSPQGKADAFVAAWEKVKRTLAGTFGDGSFFQQGLTRALNDINTLLNVFHTLTPEEQAAAIAAENARLGFIGVADAAKIAAAESAGYTKAIEASKTRSAELAQTLAALSDQLVANAKLVQDAATKAIADATANADAQIAGLDRSAAAAAATAAKTIDIQLTASDKIIKIITESQTKITEATEAGIAAREAEMRADGKKQEEIDAVSVRARIATQEVIVKAWANHYKTLQDQSQANQAAVREIESQRIGFTQQLEQAITAARGAALNASFSDYLVRQNRINELITKARQEALAGDLKQAKTYSDDAISEIGRLAPAYSANGALVVTGITAQTDKMSALKKLDTEYGEALKTRGAAAKKGADDTIEQLERVKKPLGEAKGLLDNLNRQAEKGLNVNVQLKGVQDAIRELDALTKDRTVNIIVNTIKADAVTGRPTEFSTGPFTGAPFSPFAHGGTVGQFAQRFAGGGMAFRRPNWVKVPGSGDGDTVPAALSEGSFVVRKAASQKYGDGIMGRLAQAFAGGGTVGSIGSIAMRMLSGLNPGGQNLGADPSTVQTVEEFKTARYVEEYAREVLRRYMSTADGRTLAGYLLESVQGRIAFVNAHPTDAAAIDALLAEAGYLGSNLPLISFINKTASSSGPTPRQFNPFTFADFVAALRSGAGFAGGGSVGDTVPAMLTPGEFVLAPAAVANVSKLFGGGFLHALNAMKVPHGFFDGVMNLAPPPRPLAFATGGPVPGGERFAAGGSVRGGVGGGVTVNIYAQKVDEAEVRRSVIPALNKIIRRSR